MKKKIIALCLVVALAAIAVIGGTLAYFTDNDAAENVFTVGNVDITLTEPNWETSGKIDAENVYPSEPLAKDPTVENIGANPCFVRVKVENLDCLKNAGLSAELIKIRNNAYQLDAVNEGWTLYNGYIYYNTVLAEGETTNAAFNHIVIPADVTNGASGTEYTVNVKAEAVQAQGARASWSAVQAMTVEEIDAWFATCMG